MGTIRPKVESLKLYDEPQYKYVTEFRNRVANCGLKLADVDSELPAKERYSFWVVIAELMFQRDDGDNLSNYDVKDQCIQYLTEHRKLGVIDWRTMVDNGDKYIADHRSKEGQNQCDDVMLLAYCFAFKQPLRIIDRSDVTYKVRCIFEWYLALSGYNEKVGRK